MPTFGWAAGAVRTPNGVFARVGGIWRRINQVYARQGGSWRLVFTDNFAFNIGSGTDLNLRTLAVAAGWNGIASVTATVVGGAVINASSNYALTVNGSFPNGVTLINNGTIVGRGGAGGKGGDARGDLGTWGTPYTGAAGNPGGHGFLAQVPVTVINNGVIAGGGGGGGGGGASVGSLLADDNNGGGK